MKNSKHTKGPWKVEFVPNIQDTTECDDCFVTNNIGYHVAKIYSYENQFVQHGETANAHLIAAAPEMYAELVRIIDVLSVLKIQSDREGWSNGVYFKLQIDMLCDLIKKARGES